MNTTLFRQFQYPTVPLQVSSDYRQKTLQRMISQRLESADISYGKTP
jgi:hypothetical protein